ncbi:polysaccharide deacetylase family protein [Bacteroidota bacterium]
MLTFRRVTILFFILLFSLNVIHFAGCNMEWFHGHLCSHTYVYLIILFTLYIGISVTMAFFIGSNFHHTAICQGDTKERICSLTFDDGPDPTYTRAVLDILNRETVKGTFFVIGEKLNKSQPLVKEMDLSGHLIGNHSWSHSVWFDFFTGKRMKLELAETNKAISDITGKSPLLFRPPFGVLNPTLSKAIRRFSLHVIGWNIRSLDTVQHDVQKTANRILRKVTPGSIILMHDNLETSPQLLELVLSGLKQQGYTVVPLCQLIQLEAYA